MKIRLAEHAKFQADKMAKIALATTSRAQLDLYCLEPGQSQKVHTPRRSGQGLRRARGPRPRSPSAREDRRWRRARPWSRRPAPPHGVTNDSGARLLLLVVVTPPPPHA